MSGAGKFEGIAVGDEARLRRRITAEDVDAFARVSGDDNPLHMDDGFAAQRGFGRRVAHGMLSAAYVSRLVGTRLPGTGALWFQQEFQFPVPVLVGDEVEFVVRVEHKSSATRTLVIGVAATNQHGVEVLKGSGRVMVLEEKTSGVAPEERSRVALVTGASRGIGAAVALALGHLGHRVVVNYRSSPERAQEVAAAIMAAGGEALALQADVTDPEAVAAMVATACERFDAPIEILVNNASGPIQPRPLLELDWAELQAHLEIHVRGSLNCIRAVAPGMIAAGGGHIVNLGSSATWGVPPVNYGGYAAAKAALAALGRSAALELGPKGIRVNTVAPGMTETELVADVPERVRKVIAMQTPLRRLAQADDIAAVVATLVSRAGSFIHGAEIPVAGGSVM